MAVRGATTFRSCLSAKHSIGKIGAPIVRPRRALRSGKLTARGTREGPFSDRADKRCPDLSLQTHIYEYGAPGPTAQLTS